MIYKTANNNKTFNTSKAKEIFAGGEGRIFEDPSNTKKVVKIYHKPRRDTFAKHLELLGKLPSSFIKPQDIYFTNSGDVAGFDMDYVNFNDYWLFNNLFNKGFCNSNGITSDFKIKVLVKLKDAIEDIHKKDIVIGDLNMYNLFVSKHGDIKFVDVDSYQSSAQPHSGVLLDEIRDWTTLSINKQTDSWAYDILAFWSTTFCHPFKWVVPGNSETLEQRIKNHKSYLSHIPGIKVPPLYEPPKGEIEKQFRDIFSSGRRYMVDFTGVHIPVSMVVKQAITISSNLSIREMYTNITHVHAYKTKIAVRRTDGKWLLIEANTLKTARLIEEIEGDEVFPSMSSYNVRRGNKLYFQKGLYSENVFSFIKPIFYFADGSLVVFDYAADNQKNFDLNNQMFGADYTSTQIFTKSILVRDTPIQNFGGSVYLNLPVKNRYTLVKVPEGTKNAIYTDSYVAVEYKTKSKVKFELFNSTNNTATRMELEYLPYFAVKGNVVFIPENGYIDVYQNNAVVLKLEAPVCTRDSKLYSTDSGIYLLEANILYLLNTK